MATREDELEDFIEVDEDYEGYTGRSDSDDSMEEADNEITFYADATAAERRAQAREHGITGVLHTYDRATTLAMNRWAANRAATIRRGRSLRISAAEALDRWETTPDADEVVTPTSPLSGGPVQLTDEEQSQTDSD